MVFASAYILKVPPNRRETLLSTGEERSYFGKVVAAEPVPKFDHSRRAALVVLACFDDDVVTHIADGGIGSNAGTEMVRLNLENLQPLKFPVPIAQLVTTHRLTPRVSYQASPLGWLAVYDASIAWPDGEDMVDLEPGLQQVTFRPIALTREPVLDPGTF